MRVAANRLVTGEQDPQQVTKYPEESESNSQFEKKVKKTEKLVTWMRAQQPPAVAAEQPPAVVAEQEEPQLIPDEAADPMMLEEELAREE